MTVNFFKILPVIGSRGEISISDQKLISEMFDKNVNKKITNNIFKQGNLSIKKL